MAAAAGAWIALGASLVAATPVLAQLVRREPGSAEVGVEADRQWHATATTSTVGEVRQWLSFSLGGGVGPARRLAWNATLRPGVQRRSQPDQGGPLRARQFDAAAGLRFTGPRTLGLGLDVSRASGSSSGGYGSRREFRQQAVGAGLWWRNGVLPMEASWSRRSADEVWLPGALADSFLTERTTRTLRASASNSRTSVALRRTSGAEPRTGARLDGRDLSVLHTLRWGRGSWIESTWERSRYRGDVFSDRASWRERVHLVHSRRVASDATLERARTRFGVTGSTATGASWTVTARVTPATTAALGLARYAAVSGGSRTVLVGVSPRMAWAATLGQRWRATATGGVGFERRRHDFPGDPIVPAVDEAYVVPPSRVVIIARARVDPASVVVRRGDGELVYAAGLDYAITPGALTTRIEILPGGRIQVGERVLASYHYRVDAAGTESLRRVDIALSLDGPIGGLRHARTNRRSGAAAEASGLADLDEAVTSITARHRTRAGELTADTRARHWVRAGRSARDLDISGGWSPPGVGPATLSLSTAWHRSRADGLEVRSLSAQAAAGLALPRGARVSALVEAHRWSEAARPPQRYLSSTIGAEWRLGSTDVSVRAELHRRAHVVRTTEHRVYARLTRHF